MDWRDEVIAEVGRGMGVDGLNFGGTGVISMEFERRGALFLEQKDEGVLMYLVQRVSRYGTQQLLLSAMRQCHYTRVPQFPLQVGLKEDDQLFFIVFLRNEEFTRPSVETAIEVLTQQFEKIGNS